MKRRNRVIVWGLVALVVLTLTYFGVGLFVATRLTAPDSEPMEATPASVGLDYSDVEVKSTDGIRLSGWWAPQKSSSQAVLLVHGWGGNKSNEQILSTAPIYAQAGYNVLMLDLRAHGESGGGRRTLGYRETRDIRGALDWLAGKGFGPEDIVLHGWSMGAATVVSSAPGTGVAAVVEEAGYADLPPLLRRAIPDSSGLPGLFNPAVMLSAKLFLDFDPWSVVPKNEAERLSREGTPLFIIHSTTDETVPYENARMFREAYPDAKFWRLTGYDHVEAYNHPEYKTRLLDFLESLKFEEAA